MGAELERDLSGAELALKIVRRLLSGAEPAPPAEVARAAYDLGRYTERVRVRMSEDNARVGKQSRNGARAGGHARQLSDDELAVRDGWILEAVALSKLRPDDKWSSIQKTLATKYAVSPRTMRRYTKRPS